MADSHKAVPQENIVEYTLYPELSSVIPQESKLMKLHSVGAEFVHIANSVSTEYIWNNEHFAVIVPKQEDPEVSILHGCTDFKDNIEDEWFIVHICLELTRKVDGLAISIVDSDGQFLLIEAAHHIPRWLKPETSQNRIFLYGGKVHIVPIPSNPSEVGVYPVGTPTIRSALSLIRCSTSNTQASRDVQDAIRTRIERYRSDVHSSLHHAHCHLPLLAAHVIRHQPQLVAAAVHALSDRLPSDMKSCQKMSTFSPKECVLRRVTFSKFLYAKLSCENFNPPRHAGFNLPPESHSQYKSYEIGMKLACGLEILAAQGCKQDSERPMYHIDPRWPQFLQSLRENGFFRGEVEGSQLYNKLLSSAKDFFVSMLEQEQHVESDEGSAGVSIRRILKDIPCEVDTYKTEESNLLPADDESWLQISQEDLDAELSKYTESARRGRANVMTSGEANDFDDIVHGLKSFVSKVSSHEGAEFPWVADDNSEIAFDPQEVVENVKKLLNALEEESSDEGSVLESDDHSLSSVDADENEDMSQIMKQMDSELASTELGKSFMRQSSSTEAEVPSNIHQNGHSDGEVKEELPPVDIDFNLVSNILESYASQCGDPGPASTILHTLGIQILSTDNDGGGD